MRGPDSVADWRHNNAGAACLTDGRPRKLGIHGIIATANVAATRHPKVKGEFTSVSCSAALRNSETDVGSVVMLFEYLGYFLAYLLFSLLLGIALGKLLRSRDRHNDEDP